jgi:hypothetical protein
VFPYYYQPFIPMKCVNVASQHRQSNVVPYYYSELPNRPYPDVDATLFEQSAKSTQSLLKDANLLVNKLAGSKSFAQKVMYAAQQSNTKEVNKLIKSTGIKSHASANIDPDGINLKISPKGNNTDCCQLTIGLRWR